MSKFWTQLAVDCRAREDKHTTKGGPSEQLGVGHSSLEIDTINKRKGQRRPYLGRLQLAVYDQRPVTSTATLASTGTADQEQTCQPQQHSRILSHDSTSSLTAEQQGKTLVSVSLLACASNRNKEQHAGNKFADLWQGVIRKPEAASKHVRCGNVPTMQAV